MQYFFFDMCSIQIMPVPYAHKIYTSISKIYKVLLPFQMSICFCSYIFLLLHKLVTSVIHLVLNSCSEIQLQVATQLSKT